MDPNIATLKTYINAQRKNNTSDEVIYNTLLASGWQHDIVVLALSTQVDGSNNEPSEIGATPAASVIRPATVASESDRFNQPVVERPDTSDMIRKKVKIIGKIMIALGVLATIGGVLPEVNAILLVFAVGQILVGFGILSFNKLAYTFFNILAILAILSSLLMLPGLPLMLLAMTFDPTVTGVLLGIVGILLSVGQLIFYIYGGVVFHKKDVRLLFHRKHAA